MYIEPLNTLVILAMLDVLVLSDNQLRGVHLYFNDGVQYESSVDTG